ncbi:MAG: hypothetical protein KatS3mg085_099 [Candidatus Dojkabacteria bacterium]|nr:MAG: hypothetical protein KatS3mg085_099 [Candidatus Dojkabacteria bacterium]
MDFINSIILLIALCNFFLFLIFCIRGLYKKDELYLLFSFLCLSIFIWCISMIFYRSALEVKNAELWGKILYASALMTPFMYLVFCYEKLKLSRHVFVNLLFIIVALIFFVTLNTDYIIDSIQIPVEGEKKIVFGKLYFFIYFPYFPIVFSYCYFLLLKSLNKVRFIEKIQIIIILGGSLISSLLAMITNLFLPSLNIFSLNWFGQVASIIWILAISYAVLKYRLFDFRLILGRIIYVAIISSLLFFSFYFLVYIHIILFKDIFSLPSYIFGIFIAVLYILFFDSFKNFVSQKVTSSIINPGFDPKIVISNYIQEINYELNISTIYEKTINVISKNLQPKFIKIHLSFSGKIIFSQIEDEIVIKLLNYLKQKDKIIVYNLVDQNIQEEIIRNFSLNFQQETGLILSFKSKARGINLVALFSNRNGSIPFGSSETDFLKNIFDIFVASVARAYYYQEIQNFNLTLQKKIDEATAELKRKNEDLAEALRKERDMLDILGHELRTPLGTARNALFMLKVLTDKAGLKDSKVEKYIQIARDNINREIKILETILSSARIENDRLDLTFEGVDIKVAVQNSLDAYKPQAEKKGLKMQTKIVGDNLKAYADKTGVQQILDNLVSNAVKYTEEGVVTIFAKQKDDQILFGTIDTGEGIPKREIKNLGKKFYRINPYLDSSGTIGKRQIVRPGGTGIGLYVVFSLIKNMNGQIKVESEVGKGSTFTVSLPKYNGQPRKEIKKSDISKLFENKLKKKRNEEKNAI